VQGGWEWNNNTSFLVRGWKRLSEAPEKDDNPDIVNYAGRAEIVARWEPMDKSQAVAISAAQQLEQQGTIAALFRSTGRLRQNSATLHACTYRSLPVMARA